jgi:hypothetical protein
VSPLDAGPKVPSDDRPSYGVALELRPGSDAVAGGAVAGLSVDDAPAVWSDAAMTPTSAPPTATLTPAARMRPCVLSVRRAMEELWRVQVRNC